jgi:N-acetylneuraminate synthase
MTEHQRVFVIAEAGVNHNGSLEMARALIDEAAKAGADAVKFQTFRSEQVVSAAAPKARYQVATTGAEESQLDMVRKLELAEADFRALAAHASTRGIEFMSTPFDHDSLGFLAHGLGVARLKIASGEITNGPFLLAAARTGKPIILSTGMSTLDEVAEALGVLAFGYLDAQEPPSLAAFEAARRSDEGRQILRERVVLLHCTTEYPAPFEDVNLRAMQTMREAFGLPVGYSDHTVGIGVSVAAVALGAVAIEKHFTLDRAQPGPDHKASLEPGELAALVREVRGVEAALGSPRKEPAPSELGNRAVARRSLIAARAIAAGEPFSEAALGALRPGTGVSPMAYWSLLGRPAGRTYRPGEPIEP